MLIIAPVIDGQVLSIFTLNLVKSFYDVSSNFRFNDSTNVTAGAGGSHCYLPLFLVVWLRIYRGLQIATYSKYL